MLACENLQASGLKLFNTLTDKYFYSRIFLSEFQHKDSHGLLRQLPFQKTRIVTVRILKAFTLIMILYHWQPPATLIR